MSGPTRAGGANRGLRSKVGRRSEAERADLVVSAVARGGWALGTSGLASRLAIAGVAMGTAMLRLPGGTLDARPNAAITEIAALLEEGRPARPVPAAGGHASSRWSTPRPGRRR